MARPLLWSAPMQRRTAAAGDTDGNQGQTELVERMLAGDELAWREFHDRYRRLIYRCISKVTSHFTSCIGADELRDIYGVFLTQLLSNDMKKLRSFDPTRGNRLGSWIGMLAINCAYDYLRSLRRDSGLAPLSEAEELHWEGMSPQDNLEVKERVRLVNRLLRDFSAKDREFMTLYCEGWEAEEIADKLQISLKTVYSKKHKIQTRLEAMIEGARLAA